MGIFLSIFTHLLY